MTEKSLIVADWALVDQAIRSKDRVLILELLSCIDAEGGPDEVPLDTALCKALWEMGQRKVTVHWLDECYLIWRLNQEIEADVLSAAGEIVRGCVPRWWTWESILAQRARDNPRYEWAWFCAERLGINPGTASARKRAWQVFAVIYGWTREEMERAGRGRLQQAASYAERCWKRRGEMDDKLRELLLGEPHICLACGDWVSYEGETPEDCPACGEEYRELGPASFGLVARYVQEQKEREKARRDSENDYTFALSGEEGAGEFNVLTWLLRPGAERAVPYLIAKIHQVRPVKVAAVEADGSELLGDEEYGEAWLEFRQAIVK